MRRNYCIDFSRYLFAFLVVTIHVPFIMGGKLLPLARCAVPFFFMVTGYYLYNDKDSVAQRKQRFHNAMKKWFRIWAIYAVIQYVIVLIFNIILGNDCTWTYEDLLWLSYDGKCRATDVICWEGNNYGTSTLWFLYVGAISILLLNIFTPHAQSIKHIVRIPLTIITIVYIFSMLVNLVEGQRVMPRLMFLALPSLFCGYLLHIYQATLNKVISFRCNLLCIMALFFIMYIEAYFLNQVKMLPELYLSTLPFMIFFFLLLTRLKDIAWIENLTKEIPTTVTLDIYLWHRFVYFIIVFAGFEIDSVAAVVCFTLCFLISLCVRKMHIKMVRKCQSIH